LCVFVLLAGCGGQDEAEPTVPSDGQPPTVVINAPRDQSSIQPGQVVQVEVVASDDQAVMSVELYVDDSIIESRVSSPEAVLTTRRETFTWSAAMVGPHTLQARAYDAARQMGASPVVVVQVGATDSTTAPPAAPTSPPEPASTPVPAEPSPTTPPSPTPEAAQVIAITDANVRGGPGTNYPVVGGLKESESAFVTGRNADSSWWQISFQGGTAWIANVVVTANAQAQNAPLAEAPPPPPTNTPPPPTATPAPTGTPVPASGFWADQTSLTAGQCTKLHWNFSGIKAIYISFGFGYDKLGVGGQGSQKVCPSVTTIYEAQVIKQDDSAETHQVTVNTTGSGCGDPVIKQFDPTTYEVETDKHFSIFWEVECAKAVWFIEGDGPEEGVSAKGSKIDVGITTETKFSLKVEKNSGGFVYASFTVKPK
jgi:uncharacterized protein YgiM (DUF1202 family)